MIFNRLKIFSGNLALQKEFYSLLQFPIIDDNERLFTIRAGISEVEFISSEKEKSPYHIAFNIPENQIEGAARFIAEKSNLLVDSDTGDSIIDFENWNAHSIYFLDKDRNVVEFIARHNLHNRSNMSFHPKHISSLSEIGVATTSVKNIFQILNKKLDIPRFYGNFERFCAAGTEEALFIISEEGRSWFPSEIISKASPFTIVLKQNNKLYTLSYSEDGKMNIS